MTVHDRGPRNDDGRQTVDDRRPRPQGANAQIREARDLETRPRLHRRDLRDCRATAASRGLQPQVTDQASSHFGRPTASVGLNIAEGSTGQTDAEQARFLGLALRSLIETVACQHLISRHGYLPDPAPLREAYQQSETLARKIQAMRTAIAPGQPWVRERSTGYGVDTEMEDDE